MKGLRILLLTTLFVATPPVYARTLTVQQAVNIALENDLGIESAEASERQTQAEARAALLGMFSFGRFGSLV